MKALTPPTPCLTPPPWDPLPQLNHHASQQALAMSAKETSFLKPILPPPQKKPPTQVEAQKLSV